MAQHRDGRVRWLILRRFEPLADLTWGYFRRRTTEDLRLLHPSLLWLPLLALLAVAAIIGTETLGRPLTDAEKRRFGALLREHDYPGARLVALRFAFKLTRGRERAQDLMGRADLRLVRTGWDPAEVPLARRLCRLVWSEWTNATSESITARQAEEAFLRELQVTEGISVPSTEEQAVRLEAGRAERAKAAAQIDKLRAGFDQARDDVNLLWLKHAMDGNFDLQKMATESGRDVADFYAAAKRRKRAVLRLLAKDRGVDLPEEEA